MKARPLPVIAVTECISTCIVREKGAFCKRNFRKLHGGAQKPPGREKTAAGATGAPARLLRRPNRGGARQTMETFPLLTRKKMSSSAPLVTVRMDARAAPVPTELRTIAV